ncbi:MAG TPA: VanZ family protein [Candidatus Edwardsbacteria bacterium]|nr:VanZ family protein [Candidatus Edwardsbacteria bacterium]
MKFARAWWPLLLWAAVMLAAASIHNLQAPHFLDGWDAVYHLSEFAVFGLLCYRSLRRQGLGNGRGWLLVAAASVAMAAINELYKAAVPGRHSSYHEFITDLFGALAGLGLGQALFKGNDHEQVPGDQGHV